MLQGIDPIYLLHCNALYKSISIVFCGLKETNGYYFQCLNAKIENFKIKFEHLEGLERRHLS